MAEATAEKMTVAKAIAASIVEAGGGEDDGNDNRDNMEAKAEVMATAKAMVKASAEATAAKFAETTRGWRQCLWQRQRLQSLRQH